MSKYSCNTSLLDVLFNMLLGFVALFLIAFVLAKVDEKKPKDNNVRILGDVTVTLTWPSSRNDDIDLWIRDPAGNIVFFRNPQCGLMHLDRDDVGHSSDTLETEMGKAESIGNQEIIVIRAIIPGEYVINVHAFQIREKKPIRVSVKMDRTGRARSSTILAKIVSLTMTGHEKTVARVTFNERSEVLSVSDLECSLMRQDEGRRNDPPEDWGQ